MDRKALQYIGLATCLAAAGCLDVSHVEGPSDIVQDGRITVSTNQGVLRGRVTIRQERLPIVPTWAETVARRSPADGTFELVLVAEVTPPEIEGTTLQASHSAIHGNKAYVSYNVQGPERKGGVDVFDVSDPDDVTLESMALFDDTDVSALDLHAATELYLATATDDAAFSTPAVLEIMDLQGGQVTTQSTRIDLPSYAATGVRGQGGTLYVTSGTGGEPVGGLTIFNTSTLEISGFDAFEDARAVDLNSDYLVAMKGTPGELRLYDVASGTFVQSYATGGANVPESKSTVFIAKQCAFYAAGDEGLRVVDLATGSVVVTVPVPDVDGVALEDEVTNGASASGNLVFIANGGAGLFVAEATKDLDDESGAGCGSGTFGLQVLGQVQFPDGPSANYVASKGNLLFVANGRGGLSIVKIDR